MVSLHQITNRFLKRRKYMLLLLAVYAIFLFIAKDLRLLPGFWAINAGHVYSWNIFIGAENYFDDFADYMLNLVIMIPVGILLYLASASKAVRIISAAAAAFALEWLQPLFETGIFDILSVIHLFAGGICGVIIASVAGIIYSEQQQ